MFIFIEMIVDSSQCYYIVQCLQFSLDTAKCI